MTWGGYFRFYGFLKMTRNSNFSGNFLAIHTGFFGLLRLDFAKMLLFSCFYLHLTQGNGLGRSKQNMGGGP